MEENKILKLKPVYKSYIWGGTKIRDVLKKDVGNACTVSESWELSTHEEGLCTIDGGKYDEKTLKEYFIKMGWDLAGYYAETNKRLPVMIKFIDASDNLSVQVHPGDKYALKYENDSGKNEMWYIVDCDEDAFIYMGFNRNTNKREVARRVRNGTIEEILNKVNVKKGQSYYIPAGTVHAIGAGCLICEVQQASNVTYRLYDYGRKDEDGKPRKLHLKKALSVLKSTKTEVVEGRVRRRFLSGKDRKIIAKSKTFKVTSFKVNNEFSVSSLSPEYKVMVVVEGSGILYLDDECLNIKLGETYFLNHWETLKITGKCVILMVSI